MPLLSRRRVVVVDVETTGFGARVGHTVIEIGAVVLEDGVLGPEWSSLVGPRRPIPAETTRIHGITEGMLDGAPEPGAVAGPFREICAEHPLAFHNASFDLPFLAPMLRAAGAQPLYNPVIDTRGLARGLLGSGDNSLGSLATRLELPPETAHRALGDARTTARLLIELAERWERERWIRSLDELAAISQDVMRRTAHRGMFAARTEAAVTRLTVRPGNQ